MISYSIWIFWLLVILSYCQRTAWGICCILSWVSGWWEEESLPLSLQRSAESFPESCGETKGQMKKENALLLHMFSTAASHYFMTYRWWTSFSRTDNRRVFRSLIIIFKPAMREREREKLISIIGLLWSVSVKDLSIPSEFQFYLGFAFAHPPRQ